MITFLPSPALSDCDSLYDIDDLDAYLDAQGQLSHFPTPPAPKKAEAIVQEIEIDVSDDDEEFDCEHLCITLRRLVLTRLVYHIARLFTETATVGVEYSEVDVRMIERMLVRADLPPEVLALAFNIVCGLDCYSLVKGSFYSAPNDLIVVSALSLAVSYTNDYPPTVKYWSRHVCDGAWTPSRIDRTTLQVFAALGWQLHEYSAPIAIRRALAELLSPPPTRELAFRSREPSLTYESANFSATEQLKLIVNGTSTCWVNGQITPDGSLPVESQFLRLL